MTNLLLQQRAICTNYKADFLAAPDELKIGISKNFDSNSFPINGLRHTPEGDTCGWYIWSGEKLSDDAEFFQPLHVMHLRERCPNILKYLGLAPGWRFLIAPNYIDIWQDHTLVRI